MPLSGSAAERVDGIDLGLSATHRYGKGLFCWGLRVDCVLTAIGIIVWDHDLFIFDVRFCAAAQYKAACKTLDISIYASARVLGISLSSAQRYAGGQWPVPETVAKLLRALVKLGLTEI